MGIKDMDVLKASIKIVEWLQNKTRESSTEGYVVGVSGGIDSALTSTLCALTGYKVIVVGLPIHQPATHIHRSETHMEWLENNFSNVKQKTLDLTYLYEAFRDLDMDTSDLALVNTRSRLRMAALYSIANTHNLLVAGTGNKVEDYGIGFFTKYGDGGVDVSPIADLLKSEVRELAQHLGVIDEIITATPTDGLWEDDRSDEDQIGASYEELEWALNYYDTQGPYFEALTGRQCEVLKIYIERHLASRHKLEAVPVCYIGDIDD
jgi:NAD+ synthase